MPISAFSTKSGHTFRYIRKQITINFYRDIPTFHRPSVGTLMITSLGISQLFYCPSICTQIVTSLGISQDFRLQPLWTLFVTSNLSAIVLQPRKKHFYIAFNSAVLLDISLDII